MRKEGSPISRLLQLAAWGAGVLLVWHGALFIVQGALVLAHVIRLAPDLLPVSRWYTFLWGPWFVLGGMAFAVAARGRLRRTADRRGSAIAGMVGGLGGLALSAALLLAGIG